MASVQRRGPRGSSRRRRGRVGGGTGELATRRRHAKHAATRAATTGGGSPVTRPPDATRHARSGPTPGGLLGFEQLRSMLLGIESGDTSIRVADEQMPDIMHSFGPQSSLTSASSTSVVSTTGRHGLGVGGRRDGRGRTTQPPPPPVVAPQHLPRTTRQAWQQQQDARRSRTRAGAHTRTRVPTHTADKRNVGVGGGGGGGGGGGAFGMAGDLSMESAWLLASTTTVGHAATTSEWQQRFQSPLSAMLNHVRLPSDPFDASVPTVDGSTFAYVVVCARGRQHWCWWVHSSEV
mgnify:CR=1 FL=1